MITERLTILIMLLVACAGCEYNNNSLRDIKVEKEFNYDFENDIPEFSNWREAAKWVADNITYESDANGDYWKLPEETYNDKNGDCEDYSILLAYILYEHLLIDNVELIRIQTEKGTFHMIVRIGKIYIEPQSGARILYVPPEHICWAATYPEIIWMTLNYHDSVGKYL